MGIFVSTSAKTSLSATCRASLLVISAVLLSPAVTAETLYVTDVLRLGIYPIPDTSAEPLRILVSGDALEVLERVGAYARVQTAAGLEGWVKTSYLVAEIPAKTRVAELTLLNEALRNETSDAQSGLSDVNQQLADSRSERDGLTRDLAAMDAESAALRSENEALNQQLAETQFKVPLVWICLAVILALGGGFLGGWWWTDARQRARHGGYRI